MIKAIAMDMDGTLLNKKSELSQGNLNALLRVQKQGVRLILASGRNETTLFPFGYKLLMDQYEGKFIGANGIAITDVSTQKTKTLAQCSFMDQRKVFQFASEYGLEFMGVQNKKIFHYVGDHLKEIKLAYAKEHGLDTTMPLTGGTFHIVVDQRPYYPDIICVSHKDELHEECNKMILSTTPQCMSQVEALIYDVFHEHYQCSKTGPSWMEITPKGITKGAALQMILNEWNMSADEVMCFGDAENDLSMLLMTKYSVAMGNAMDIVKEKCNYQTSTNDEDGIAHMIKRCEQANLLFSQ